MFSPIARRAQDKGKGKIEGEREGKRQIDGNENDVVTVATCLLARKHCEHFISVMTATRKSFRVSARLLYVFKYELMMLVIITTMTEVR